MQAVVIAAFLFIFLTPATTLSAQSIPKPSPDMTGIESPLAVGARVRVTIPPEARPQVLTFRGLRDSLILLQADSASINLSRNMIERLDVSRGHKPSVTGGIVGALAGAAVGGFMLGCLANKDDYGVLCGGQNDTQLVLGAVLGGVVGGGLGAMLFRQERWIPVDLDRLWSTSAP
jgi:hypothetical protein